MCIVAIGLAVTAIGSAVSASAAVGSTVLAAATSTAGMAALTVGSIGFSTYSAFAQQDAQNDADEYNAKLAERNAEISNMQAKFARERGDIEAEQHRDRVRRQIGAQRAAYAGSGIQVDEGTAEEIVLETAGFGELDALTIKRNSQVEAFGHTAQAGGYQGESALLRSQKQSPYKVAAATLISETGKLAASRYTSTKLKKAS